MALENDRKKRSTKIAKILKTCDLGSPKKQGKCCFYTSFATFQPCQTSFITSISGTDLGHLGGVRREVQKRTPPKHTTPVEGPKGDFLASESLPFSGKILQDGVLEDTP